MPAPEQPRFNLRLTPELQAELERAKSESGHSMNREILSRLERTFEPDAALQLADSIRPILDKMSEEDRQKVVMMVADTFTILAKKPRKR